MKKEKGWKWHGDFKDWRKPGGCIVVFKEWNGHVWFNHAPGVGAKEYAPLCLKTGKEEPTEKPKEVDHWHHCKMCVKHGCEDPDCAVCKACKVEEKSCEGWCRGHKHPWDEKCNWPACAACDICHPEKEEPTEKPKEVEEKSCEGWCRGHKHPWDKKCNWPACAACGICRPGRHPRPILPWHSV